MKENEEETSERHPIECAFSLIKKEWQILTEVSFLITVVLGILSMMILQLNFAIIWLNSFEIAIRALTLTDLLLMILGILGFLGVSREAARNVEKRYNRYLKEALGTDKYYHAWSKMARDLKVAEGTVSKRLNSLLLAVTLSTGILSLFYIIATYPIPHPLYQLIVPQALSIWLSAMFLHEKRSTITRTDYKNNQ
ncbi:MAG: hypothetical protein QXJ07_01890 [Candidatus Bathyarchaeia archaeon]